ncbi:MAG: phosphoglucomutase/phosphomannomutase family protein [Eubacteriales bacterium]|nr:phosphoglucomutase/phosphomannomutase family protein [Eubacteriales bacterium]
MISFGTGGWRAEIGKDFCMSNIQRVAQGLADTLLLDGKTDRPVVIGYDRRFLSYEAAVWVAETLAANNISVLFMHRSVPTPLVMYLVKEMGLHRGVEITASHNPSSYNGIKIIVEEGRDAPGAVTVRLEEAIRAVGDARSIPLCEAEDRGLLTYLKNPFNDFIDSILARVDVSVIRARGPRILFDSMHGSSTYPLTVILNTARCTVDQIHAEKDAYFGGMMPAPSEDTMDELRYRVMRGKYDLGIAVDGDGDRLGIVDSAGRYISANEILVLLYRYLHEVKGWKGPAVRNLSTTHLLDRVAESFGEKCYEVPVGFKHISAKIDEVDAVLGGESSGGLTVRGHIHGKDSTYSSALFVEMISSSEKSPSEMMEEIQRQFGRYIMKESNIRFSGAQRDELSRRVLEARALPEFETKPVRVSYLDGVKAYFADDSFVICRFSGTEPLLRIAAEGHTEEQAKGYIAAWESLIGSFGCELSNR